MSVTPTAPSARALKGPASLKFWKDRFIWGSPLHSGADTCRPVVAVLIGGWGPLTVTTRQETLSTYCAAVAPNIHRSVVAQKGFYSLNLDPTSAICRFARTAFVGDCVAQDLADRLSADSHERVRAAIDQPQSCESAFRLSEQLIGELFQPPAVLEPVDPRIVAVSEHLRKNLPNRLALNDLASLCELSPSRLTHLFKEQTGASLKNYLLAMRMRRAAELFGASRPLTEVAHDIGFSDSAHLTRTFRAYFSVTPSLLADPQRVEITVCDPIEP